MNLEPANGVIISVVINDMKQDIYKKGYAANLLIVDMGIDKGELNKLLSSTYRSCYTKLLSYGKYPRKKSGCVPIMLAFGQAQQYKAKLHKHQKSPRAWISAGPVKDKHGNDVKLAGALDEAGFPIRHWTLTQIAVRTTLPKPKLVPLLTVKFLVKGQTWTLLSASRLTQSSGLPNTNP